MNKHTHILTLALVGFLVFPVFVLAQSSTSEKNPGVNRFQKAEQRVNDRIEKMEQRALDRKTALEEKAKARQEKNAEWQKKIEERKAEVQKNFCANMVERTAERQNDFTERQNDFTARKTERLEERKVSRAENDEELASKRTAASERRAKMYQNLMNKATTDEQKEAVETFKTTVEKAVKEREAAIDAAKLAFRNGIDAARTSRKTDGTDALAAFKATMQSALSEAKSDCEAGQDQGTVRSEYLATLAEARKTLQEARKENGIGDTVSELAKTRAAAVKEALTTYKNTLEAAFQALREVLGNEAPAKPDPEPEA